MTALLIACLVESYVVVAFGTSYSLHVFVCMFSYVTSVPLIVGTFAHYPAVFKVCVFVQFVVSGLCFVHCFVPAVYHLYVFIVCQYFGLAVAFVLHHLCKKVGIALGYSACQH